MALGLLTRHWLSKVSISRPTVSRTSTVIEARTLPDGSLISNGCVLAAEYPNPGLL